MKPTRMLCVFCELFVVTNTTSYATFNRTVFLSETHVGLQRLINRGGTMNIAKTFFNIDGPSCCQ